MDIRSRDKWGKTRWRRKDGLVKSYCRFLEQCDDSLDFPTVLKSLVDNYVLIVLTAGGDFSAVMGVLSAVHREHVTLISGNIVTLIPIERIAAISHLAGGGPTAPSRTALR